MSETTAEKAHRLALQAVCAGVMDELISSCKAEGLEGVGFAFAYASNGSRQDMIKMLREAVTKLERGA